VKGGSHDLSVFVELLLLFEKKLPKMLVFFLKTSQLLRKRVFDCLVCYFFHAATKHKRILSRALVLFSARNIDEDQSANLPINNFSHQVAEYVISLGPKLGLTIRNSRIDHHAELLERQIDCVSLLKALLVIWLIYTDRLFGLFTPSQVDKSKATVHCHFPLAQIRYLNGEY
jgi:hypothetical protein